MFAGCLADALHATDVAVVILSLIPLPRLHHHQKNVVDVKNASHGIHASPADVKLIAVLVRTVAAEVAAMIPLLQQRLLLLRL